jgi:hypothetical protein
VFAADAATFLADAGETVGWTPSAGGASFGGPMLFDQPENPIEGGDVQSRQYMATFETAAWPGLKRGEVLVIGGAGGNASYKLRTDPRAADDGVFSSVQLSKV